MAGEEGRPMADDQVRALLDSMADEVIELSSQGEPEGAAAAAVLGDHQKDQLAGETFLELAILGLFSLASQRRAFLERARKAN